MSLNMHQSKYLETSVQTATPGQLLLMLYDGAAKNCRMAIESIKLQNFADANRFLIKAQDIISELLITLDRSVPISEQLGMLYNYFIERLIQANLKKDIEPVQEVLSYVVDLRETWTQAIKANGGTQSVEANA